MTALRYDDVGGTVEGSEGRHRYALRRTAIDGAPLWAPSGRSALFVLLHPPLAQGPGEDRSVSRCKSLAVREGCSNLTIANLFSLRVAKPKHLEREGADGGVENDRAIASAASGSQVVVCAWGDPGLKVVDERADFVLELLQHAGARPVCLGETVRGMPRQPLLVPGSAELVRYHGRRNGSNR